MMTAASEFRVKQDVQICKQYFEAYPGLPSDGGRTYEIVALRENVATLDDGRQFNVYWLERVIPAYQSRRMAASVS